MEQDVGGSGGGEAHPATSHGQLLNEKNYPLNYFRLQHPRLGNNAGDSTNRCLAFKLDSKVSESAILDHNQSRSGHISRGVHRISRLHRQQTLWAVGYSLPRKVFPRFVHLL